MTPKLHIVLIGGMDAGIPAATELLQVNQDLIVTIFDTDEYRASPVQRLNLVKESPVFYQPWNNRLITFEGNIYHYDYLFLATQSNNISSLQQSVLTDKNGMIDVTRKTLRHKRYHNIFACSAASPPDPGGKDYTSIISQLRRLVARPILKKFFHSQISAIECAA